ncbi:MAG: type II toxin-antitoxin system VapC family toxin [Thermoguttaceae bacterium]|nr:type II toxin-antitoxin system VapC family toxin [Thermoguttaceae bacterium]MDW8039204.1 type II toxin-antitoxin system VapC family toxin [Thermoguttaceae bacterium]
MKLLLDTHSFIWWDSEPAKLSPQVLAACQDPQNILLLSVVSLWEIQIKRQLGKIKLALPLQEIVETQQRINHLEILPVILPHVLALDNLPPHHKDPFDRLLIAQAIVEKAVLVSTDPNIARYPVSILG